MKYNVYIYNIYIYIYLYIQYEIPGEQQDELESVPSSHGSQEYHKCNACTKEDLAM